MNRKPSVAKSSSDNDPCNRLENVRKPQPGILWPNLQTRAAQDLIRPPKTNVSFGKRPFSKRDSTWMEGDRRIDPFQTSYSLDFDAPFEESKCIRSPMRNNDLAKSDISLRNHYIGSYNRVGPSVFPFPSKNRHSPTEND